MHFTSIFCDYCTPYPTILPGLEQSARKVRFPARPTLRFRLIDALQEGSRLATCDPEIHSDVTKQAGNMDVQSFIRQFGDRSNDVHRVAAYALTPKDEALFEKTWDFIRKDFTQGEEMARSPRFRNIRIQRCLKFVYDGLSPSAFVLICMSPSLSDMRSLNDDDLLPALRE